MQITPIYLVLAALIGLLIGLLVASLFNPRESKHLDKTIPAELAKDGFAEIARLWYSPGVKKVITELDGENYRDYLTLSPDQKSRVNRMIALWSDWAGKAQTSQVEKTGIEEAQIQPPHPAESAIVQNEESPAIPLLLEDAVVKAIETTTPIVVEKPKTIAGQISLIIDHMLIGNPLREKGIKLIENDHHGVDVWIGMEKFDGIDSIPYQDVQRLIREAVAKWECESEMERKAL